MEASSQPPRRLLVRAMLPAAWASIVFSLAVALTLRYAGERWWPATLLLYAARWPWALPGGVLALVALVLRQWRALALVAVGVTVILVAVMGLEAPLWFAPSGAPGAMSLRVLSCNTHGGATRPADISRLIAQERPDVVAFQEWEARSPRAIFDSSWHVLRDGELLIASRYPLQRVKRVMTPAFEAWGQGHGAVVQYEITTPQGAVRLFNVHLESPHYAISAALRHVSGGAAAVQQNSDVRLSQAQRLAQAARQVETMQPSGLPLICAGDFNTPCDSQIYRSQLSWLRDAFSERGWGFGRTYFHRGAATRIDHILCNSAWRVRGCRVGPDVGSPHRPVIAELQRVTK